MIARGLLALLFYAVHGGHHLLHGRPADLLWACHLGTVLVGVGLLGRRAAWNAVGVSWLCLGNLLWTLDLWGGGELVPTTFLTHLGGLALGALGVVRLGWRRWTSLRAVAGLAALWVVCRLVTPWQANVNLAFHVHPGWERAFPSYPLYLLVLLGLAAAVCFAAEVAFTRLGRRAGPPRGGRVPA